MRRHHLIWVLLLAVLQMYAAPASKSMEKRIEQIRKAYAARLEPMTRLPYDDVRTDQLVVNDAKILPATGLATWETTYYYFFDVDEKIKPHYNLYFFTKRSTLAHGIYNMSYEFLLDSETGKLMFVLATSRNGNDEATPMQWRYYYDEQERLIKQDPPAQPQQDDDNTADDPRTLVQMAHDHLKFFNLAMQLNNW